MFVEKRKERLARIRAEKAAAAAAEKDTIRAELQQAVKAARAQVIIGIDEVGTGALAGPVVIGAVVTAPNFEMDVKDSKAYNPSPKKRLEAYQRIQTTEGIIFQALEVVETEELIEKGQAEAMRLGYTRLVDRVVRALGNEYENLLIAMDGKVAILTEVPQVTLIKGDAHVVPISAASVIAKIHRDGIMSSMDKKYPGYKFGVHKGYGTQVHMQLLNHHGPCDIHRTYIDRIRQALEKKNESGNTRSED